MVEESAVGLSEKEAIRKVLACSNLKVYCDYYSVTIDDIKQQPQLAIHILKHRNSLEQLIAGYSEMESINQNICTEFQRCEQECQSMIQELVKDRGSNEFKN